MGKFLGTGIWKYSSGIITISLLLILSQCLVPLDNGFSRFISHSSGYIMLGMFTSGFIALFLHRPYLMLYSWLCTILLCQFLKDSQNNPFYYSKLNGSDQRICIAYLDLEDSLSGIKMLLRAEKMQADIISVISTKPDYWKEPLNNEYPFCLKLALSSDKKYNSIYSKNRIEVSDTIFYLGNTYYCADISLDSTNSKKLHFISFSINDRLRNNPDELLNCYKKISKHRISENMHNPLMVLGDVSSYAWEQELRELRSRMVLNDSRLDLDLGMSGKHIFYSSHFRCVKYETDPFGVIGVYQLKSENERDRMKNEFFLSQR